MNPQLNHMVARERIADLHRVAERERLATTLTAGAQRPRRFWPFVSAKTSYDPHNVTGPATNIAPAS